MSDYNSFVLKNLQMELDNQEYAKRLRRRRNQCLNHSAKYDSPCAGCRVAYWMKQLDESNPQKEEFQQADGQTNDVKPQTRPSIGLTNTVKSEGQTNEAVKTEAEWDYQEAMKTKPLIDFLFPHNL